MTHRARFWLAIGAIALVNVLVVGVIVTHRASAPAPSTGAGTTNASSQIIVLRHIAGQAVVWAVDPRDNSGHQITDPGADVELAAAPPSGQSVAYVVRGQDSTHWSLWTVGLTGQGSQSVVTDQEGTVTSLAWSPTGDAIAYEFGQAFGSLVSPPRIWLATPGTCDTALMYGRGRETGSYPSWSRDGRRIAFYENDQRVIAIYDFTSHLQTIPAQVPSAASWSPDGGSLAYVDRNGDDDARTVMRIGNVVDGTSRALTDGASGADSSPAWSSGGDWIALSRLTGTSDGIWLVHPDGSDLHPLQIAEGWVYSAPVWAPDGNALAFSRRPALAGQSSTDAELWLASVNDKPHQLNTRGSVVAWIP